MIFKNKVKMKFFLKAIFLAAIFYSIQSIRAMAGGGVPADVPQERCGLKRVAVDEQRECKRAMCVHGAHKPGSATCASHRPSLSRLMAGRKSVIGQHHGHSLSALRWLHQGEKLYAEYKNTLRYDQNIQKLSELFRHYSSFKTREEKEQELERILGTYRHERLHIAAAVMAGARTHFPVNWFRSRVLLHIAVVLSDVPLTTFLLESGADPKEMSDEFAEPQVFWARPRGLAELLLEHGATVGSKEKPLKTRRFSSILSCVVQHDYDPELIPLYLQHLEDPDIDRPHTALHQLVEMARFYYDKRHGIENLEKKAHYLIDAGARLDIKKPMEDGQLLTPLESARRELSNKRIGALVAVEAMVAILERAEKGRAIIS